MPVGRFDSAGQVLFGTGDDLRDKDQVMKMFFVFFISGGVRDRGSLAGGHRDGKFGFPESCRKPGSTHNACTGARRSGCVVQVS